MKTTNVTLTLPDPLLRKFRVYAATKNRSMSSLMADAMERIVDASDEVERAAERAVRLMRTSRDIGLTEDVTWTRDELHER